MRVSSLLLSPINSSVIWAYHYQQISGVPRPNISGRDAELINTHESTLIKFGYNLYDLIHGLSTPCRGPEGTPFAKEE